MLAILGFVAIRESIIACRHRDAIRGFNKYTFGRIELHRPTWFNGLANIANISGIELRDLPFGRIREIHVHDFRWGDREMRLLDGIDLSDLEVLVLSGTNVTDASMTRFQGCDRLRWVQLAGTEVSNDSFATLAHLPRLKGIVVSQTQVTEAEVERVRFREPSVTVISHVFAGDPTRISEPKRFANP